MVIITLNWFFSTFLHLLCNYEQLTTKYLQLKYHRMICLCVFLTRVTMDKLQQMVVMNKPYSVCDSWSSYNSNNVHKPSCADTNYITCIGAPTTHKESIYKSAKYSKFYIPIRYSLFYKVFVGYKMQGIETQEEE